MDDLTAKLAVSFITEVFKEVVKGGKALTSTMSNKGQMADVLGQAAAKYRANSIERYDFMRIFGMAKPIPIGKIYIRVNVLEKITSRQQKSISDLQEIFDIHQQRFGWVSVTKPGMEVVESQESFILLGRPGSGKTTFLKHILLESLSGRLSRKRIPIFVSLKDLSDSRTSLFDHMIREFELSGVPSAAQFLESLLGKGRCIVLLDGLDEVSQERLDQINREIKEVSEKFRNNQYILSCRVAAYNFWFPRFTDVEIADFGPNEVRTFVFNWFSEDPPKASSCWDALIKSPNLKELTSTPLLLAMLCLAYDETMDFASNRTEIYRDSIEALLKKWDKSRSIKREKVYKNLTVKRREEMLGIIAATTFESEEYFFSYSRVVDLIRAFICKLPEVRDGDAQEDAGAVLTSIEEQHGLIVERAAKVYSFSHLTFQEYLTASYIVSAGQESQSNLISQHLDNVRWREVIIMVANLLPDAEDFMILVLKKMVSLGFDGKYLSMLQLPKSPSEKIINNPNPLAALGLSSDEDRGLRELDLKWFIQNWRERLQAGEKVLLQRFLKLREEIEKSTAFMLIKDKDSVSDLEPFLDAVAANLDSVGGDLPQALKAIDQVALNCPDWDEPKVHTFGSYSGWAHAGLEHISDLSKKSIVRGIKRSLESEAKEGSGGDNELQLFTVAETVAEIIRSYVYIGKDVRDAIVLTITSPSRFREYVF